MGSSQSTPIRRNAGRCPHCGSALDGVVYTFGKGEHVVLKPCACPAATAEREALALAEDEERRREDRRVWRTRFNLAGIPPKYHDAPLRNERALRTVEQGRGLYLQGPNGTGKTELASAIACRMLRRGVKTRFTSAAELKSALFSTDFKSQTEELLFQRLARAQLLVIDDIGKESDSKPVVAMLFRVVDDRDKMQRPVIMTSNLTKQQLTERLAEAGDESTARAITSRLFGMTEKVDMGGRDWRIPAR